MNKQQYEALHKKVADFMKETEPYFREGKDVTGLYDYREHYYLYEASAEIMVPIPEENWPKKFKSLSPDLGLGWPGSSIYSYYMDVICGLIPEGNLYFGYAFIDGKPVKTAFFGQWFPRDFDRTLTGAIDPVAIMLGIKVDCYIGISVPVQDILFAKTAGKSPLEVYFQRLSDEEHKKRIERIEWERKNVKHPFYHSDGRVTYHLWGQLGHED